MEKRNSSKCKKKDSGIETSVKESTRSQRYEGRNYKDLREIIRKKRQGRENVGSSSQLEKGSLSCLSED